MAEEKYAEWFKATYTVDDPRMFDGSLQANGKDFDFWLPRKSLVDAYKKKLADEGHVRPHVNQQGFWKQLNGVLPPAPEAMKASDRLGKPREAKRQGILGYRGIWNTRHFNELVAGGEDALVSASADAKRLRREVLIADRCQKRKRADMEMMRKTKACREGPQVEKMLLYGKHASDLGAKELRTLILARGGKVPTPAQLGRCVKKVDLVQAVTSLAPSSTTAFHAGDRQALSPLPLIS